MHLRLAEDVFVEVSRTSRSKGDHPRWIANRIWRRHRAERALTIWRRNTNRARDDTFRVVARVQSERSFLRTELRRELTAAIKRTHPDWKPADPAAIEVWVTEYTPGRFVAGLRLSSASMRQHGGRAIERRGALRPTVAAAMVRLAGTGGRLLDPCCGSGTILLEAMRAGWSTSGTDIDPESIRIATWNAPNARIGLADVRSLPYEDGALDACVTNLPFGNQFRIDEQNDWLAEATGEMARVTRDGGSVVALSPALESSLPATLRIERQLPIRLLGTPTTIWHLRRTRFASGISTSARAAGRQSKSDDIAFVVDPVDDHSTVAAGESRDAFNRAADTANIAGW
jgi:23S rRNA G2445 N2-methylase RlmL